MDHFFNTDKSTESDSSNDTEGKGLKILTPNQMLSRLPIPLAQLKAGKILKNLKTKLGSCCVLCTNQKNLQSKPTKV